MARRRNRTRRGDAATEVILRTFRANGALIAAGDELAAEEGLTSARWQVLGAIALERRPLTVPQIARRMGLTRQSVQASVNRLLEDGMVAGEENPGHRRSPLIGLTALGERKYEALERRQAAWVNGLAAVLTIGELETAARVLEALTNGIEAADGAAGRRSHATP